MKKRHKLNPWHMGAVYKTWTHRTPDGEFVRTSILSYPMNPRKILTKAQGRVGTRKQAKRRRAKAWINMLASYFPEQPHCEPVIQHI